MNRDDIIARIVAVMEETFDLDAVAYRDELSAADIPEWDSLSNIRFMVAIEQAFGRRLTMPQWQGLTCLGDLVAVLGEG